MSPWWLRPTSDGDEDKTSENRAKSAPYEPASLSQHTEPLPEAVEDEVTGTDRAPFRPQPADSWREPADTPRHSERFDPSSESSDAPAPRSEDRPFFERAVEAPSDHGAEHADDAHDDDDADDAADGDDFEGEGDDTAEDGEASDEETSGEPGSPEATRKRRRRGGRRRRGKSNGNGHATPEVGDAAPIAAAPAPERTERTDRPERRPERDRDRQEARPRPAASDRAERIAELPPVDFDRYSSERYGQREIIIERAPAAAAEEAKIALFCDLENVALGVRDSDIKKFDIDLVLERLLEKGKIIVKKAYCDWERYSEYKRAFHESAIELIDIPQKHYSGKNSADIKMVVDAMDLSYSKEHLDTFVLLSGDSDFSPLVSKLKENNKRVIGIGVKNSSSSLLIDNCDEFLFYEDIWREQQQGPQIEGITKKQGEAFNLMTDAIQALMRENKDVLWGSMIKQTMKRKKPSFNESYFGYSTFSELLQDAEKKGLIKLRKDQRSGSLIVTGLAGRR
jgi:uncharacterized protein (TIGR00288 family)